MNDQLNVIIVLSNPCQYLRRYTNAIRFIKRYRNHPFLRLHIVELAYENHPWIVTQPNHPRHLRIRHNGPVFWTKECLINRGVSLLLPPDWKSFAWIDADLEFQNPYWVQETLEQLDQFQVIQLFSHVWNMNERNEILNIRAGIVYQHHNEHVEASYGKHPGFAWAITRNAYERIGGLFEYALLGGGDHVMAQSFLRNRHTGFKQNEYLQHQVDCFRKRIGKPFRVGYTSGILYHFYHGSVEDRQYQKRHEILFQYHFNDTFVKKDSHGLFVPTDQCPSEFLDAIRQYFQDRKEDEGLDWIARIQSHFQILTYSLFHL